MAGGCSPRGAAGTCTELAGGCSPRGAAGMCTELAGGCSRVAHVPALGGWVHCTPRCCRCRRAAGDKGNNFYLIKEGTAEVMLTDASGETKHVRTLSSGNSCGELSLLTGSPRSATVQATSDTLVLLMVNRRMFNATIGDAIIRKRARWKDFIRDLPAIGPPPARALPAALPATRTQHAAHRSHPRREAAGSGPRPPRAPRLRRAPCRARRRDRRVRAWAACRRGLGGGGDGRRRCDQTQGAARPLHCLLPLATCYLRLTYCHILTIYLLSTNHLLLTTYYLLKAPLAFYIVYEGRVACLATKPRGHTKPLPKRIFSRGDFFGHAEILQDKEGSQPVRRAEGGRAVLLTLTPAQFYQLVPLHVLVKDSHEQASVLVALTLTVAPSLTETLTQL